MPGVETDCSTCSRMIVNKESMTTGKIVIAKIAWLVEGFQPKKWGNFGPGPNRRMGVVIRASFYFWLPANK